MKSETKQNPGLLFQYILGLLSVSAIGRCLPAPALMLFARVGLLDPLQKGHCSAIHKTSEEVFACRLRSCCCCLPDSSVCFVLHTGK